MKSNPYNVPKWLQGLCEAKPQLQPFQKPQPLSPEQQKRHELREHRTASMGAAITRSLAPSYEKARRALKV